MAQKKDTDFRQISIPYIYKHLKVFPIKKQMFKISILASGLQFTHQSYCFVFSIRIAYVKLCVYTDPKLYLSID